MNTSDPRSRAGRPVGKRKILGQVFTPEPIAGEMVTRLLVNRPNRPISILDPCVGPATFPRLMIESGLLRPGDLIDLIDLDEEMIAKCESWAETAGQKVKLTCGDYLDVRLDAHYDYVVLNPPYLRQEWLDGKNLYQENFRQHYGLKVPGTSNLYVYFIAKVLRDLKPGGAFACIVYDSWQSTKYGQWLSQIIDVSCSAIEVVPVNDQPFDGRLIDATLIFGVKKDGHPPHAEATSTVESTKTSHDHLSGVDSFSSIGELYKTKRGLRLKQADFFLCDMELVTEGATPFVKKIARVDGYMVPPDHPEAALLIKRESDNPAVFSELERRLSVAQNNPGENESILTWHRERPESWMLHQGAPQAPLLFNYYLRKRPRHLYNPSRAYSDNFYGLTMPDGIPPFAALASLNSTAVCAEILANARNQGSGLAKVQLFEYRLACAPDLRVWEGKDLRTLDSLGRELAGTPSNVIDTLQRIDQLLFDFFKDPRLEPREVLNFFTHADHKARRPKEA